MNDHNKTLSVSLSPSTAYRTSQEVFIADTSTDLTALLVDASSSTPHGLCNAVFVGIVPTETQIAALTAYSASYQVRLSAMNVPPAAVKYYQHRRAALHMTQSLWCEPPQIRSLLVRTLRRKLTLSSVICLDFSTAACPFVFFCHEEGEKSPPK